MSLLSIKSALQTKLNAMGSLKAVFAFETGNPDGKYPFATITLRGGEADFITTRHNRRRYVFTIKVYQEQAKIGQGLAAAEDISTDVMNEMEQAFDMDTTLSGSCKYVRPINWDATWVHRDLNTRVLEIQVEATDIVSSI